MSLVPSASVCHRSQGPTLAATGAPGLSNSHLFFVRDAHTHTQFLVDTGSEVSAIPPTLADRRHSRPTHSHGSQ